VCLCSAPTPIVPIIRSEPSAFRFSSPLSPFTLRDAENSIPGLFHRRRPGRLFGAVMAGLPEVGSKEQPATLSVNERTGKPQFHITGKPEIK
jgi:hypothetical protein